MPRILAGLVVAVVVGCGSGDPPNAVGFTSNKETITEGKDATLTLTVSDPQGADDVVGFTISDERSDKDLVNFQGEPSEDGVYTVTVSWDDFVALEPLDFEREQTRFLDAVFTDSAGNVSGPISLELGLICRRMGGTGAMDRCFNVLSTNTAATSNCETICTDSDFTCDAARALEVFDDVGQLFVSVDDNGTAVDVTLSATTCETRGTEIPFQISSGEVVLSPGGNGQWTCNCSP